MKIIVLDTNIIYKDFWFENPEIRTLFNMSIALEIEFHIPKIVLDETVNCFAKVLRDNYLTLRNVKDSVEKLALMNFEMNQIDLDAKVEQYRAFINLRFSGPDGEVIEYPDIEHEEIAHRAISRTKPFKEFKKKVVGYRDTLIWYSLLDIARKEVDRIFFVTDNYLDFCHEEELHQQLKNDLTSNGYADDLIKPYRSINDLFQKEFKSAIETIEELKEDFNENRIEGFNRNTLVEAIEQLLLYKEIKYQLPNSNSEEARIAYIECEFGELEDVWKIEKDEFAFVFSIEALVQFEYFIDKLQSLGGDFKEIEIIDNDWNAHVMLVSKSANIAFEVWVTFNIEAKSITDIEYYYTQ